MEICKEDEEGYSNADYIILVGAKARGPGMDRKDLLKTNANLFKSQSIIMKKVLKPTTRILMVGNPCNTNALVMKNILTNISPENITALSKLDQNRAICQVSQKLNVPTANIFNVNIYGNHSKTMHVDITSAFYVDGVDVSTIKHFSDIQEGIL